MDVAALIDEQMKNRTPVLLESRYAGDVEFHVAYAQAAMRDCLLHRREAPFASHLIYTQILDDNDAHERCVGIAAGLVVGSLMAHRSVFYIDPGLSSGIHQGVRRADEAQRPKHARRLGLTKVNEIRKKLRREPWSRADLPRVDLGLFDKIEFNIADYRKEVGC